MGDALVQLVAHPIHRARAGQQGTGGVDHVVVIDQPAAMLGRHPVAGQPRRHPQMRAGGFEDGVEILLGDDGEDLVSCLLKQRPQIRPGLCQRRQQPVGTAQKPLVCQEKTLRIGP